MATLSDFVAALPSTNDVLPPVPTAHGNGSLYFYLNDTVGVPASPLENPHAEIAPVFGGDGP